MTDCVICFTKIFYKVKIWSN